MATHTDLCRKLGVHAGQTIRVVKPPAYYFSLLNIRQSDLTLATDDVVPVDFIHLFETDKDLLEKALPRYLKQLKPGGVVWISWPKRMSGIPTTLDKSSVRSIAAAQQLMDVKVCSLDPIWSALKFMPIY